MILDRNISDYIRTKIKNEYGSISVFCLKSGMNRANLTNQLNLKKEISMDQFYKVLTEIDMTIYFTDNEKKFILNKS